MRSWTEPRCEATWAPGAEGLRWAGPLLTASLCGHAPRPRRLPTRCGDQTGKLLRFRALVTAVPEPELSGDLVGSLVS